MRTTFTRAYRETPYFYRKNVYTTISYCKFSEVKIDTQSLDFLLTRHETYYYIQ